MSFSGVPYCKKSKSNCVLVHVLESNTATTIHYVGDDYHDDENTYDCNKEATKRIWKKNIYLIVCIFTIK